MDHSFIHCKFVRDLERISTLRIAFIHVKKYIILQHIAAVVPVAVAMMTPIPLLAALAIQKARSLMGYQTEGRCPVAVSAEPAEMDLKDSESKQKLVRDADANDAEGGIDDDRDGAKPIIKSTNGCPMTMKGNP